MLEVHAQQIGLQLARERGGHGKVLQREQQPGTGLRRGEFQPGRSVRRPLVKEDVLAAQLRLGLVVPAGRVLPHLVVDHKVGDASAPQNTLARLTRA